MAFIDELSTKFTKMVKKIGEKSEELVGLGKLNYEIYKEEDTVKKLYSRCLEPLLRLTMLIRPEYRLRTYLQYRLCPVPLKNMRASGRKCIQADTGMLMLC